MYVFDTNVFSQLFRFYYRDRFPSLWKEFDSLVDDGRVTSTREVKLELEDFGKNAFKDEITKIRHLLRFLLLLNKAS